MATAVKEKAAAAAGSETSRGAEDPALDLDPDGDHGTSRTKSRRGVQVLCQGMFPVPKYYNCTQSNALCNGNGDDGFDARNKKKRRLNSGVYEVDNQNGCEEATTMNRSFDAPPQDTRDDCEQIKIYFKVLGPAAESPDPNRRAGEAAAASAVDDQEKMDTEEERRADHEDPPPPPPQQAKRNDSPSEAGGFSMSEFLYTLSSYTGIGPSRPKKRSRDGEVDRSSLGGRGGEEGGLRRAKQKDIPVIDPKQQHPPVVARSCSSSLTPVAMIMGLAADHKGWDPQANYLAAEGYLVLLIDNRGVGRSDAPKECHAYSTEFMARDLLSIMDWLEWSKVHVAGHSMGGMIAAKLAALASNRVASLALLNTSQGGLNALPGLNNLGYLIAVFRAQTPEDRAKADLECHFSPEHLKADEQRYRRLLEEYTRATQESGQDGAGQSGQLRAVRTHGLSNADYELIRQARYPKLVIHGFADVVAPYKKGEGVAIRIAAELYLLKAGHFTNKELPEKVNRLLAELFDSARPGPR